MSHVAEQLYRDLLGKLSRAPGRWRSDPLVVFAGLKGQKYDNDLVVVGRATNGWRHDVNADEMLEAGSLEKKVVEVCEANHAMSWVTDCWGAEKAKNDYNSKKSAFWRVVREVVRGLSVADVEHEPWPEYICWSELFKLAPDGRNPSEALKKVQLSDCTKILKAEIRSWTPRRVLFLTGLGWAQPFLAELGFIEESKMQDPEGAVGSILDGVKVVVLPHPERKPGPPIVTAAVNYLAHHN